MLMPHVVLSPDARFSLVHVGPTPRRSPIQTNFKIRTFTQMAKTKLRPLDDRVVVQPVEAEERTAGGIVLPDAAREKPQRGTVISVGPGKLLESGNRGE